MIIVHHLNFSRSTRVLWLLEELGLPYELVSYQRDANFRAPASLKSVQPLGKAPVIEDGGLVLAESAVILAHINDRHGAGRLAPPAGSDTRAIHDEWLHYAESTAGFSLMMTVIGAMAGGLSDALQGFIAPELRKTLDYWSQGIGDGPWLMGDAFTIADIQTGYLIASAEHAGLLSEHPALIAYLDRLKARPALVRAIAAGGPMVPPKG